MRWFKDPLILFFIGGAGLFAMAEFVDSEEISYQIDIREVAVIEEIIKIGNRVVKIKLLKILFRKMEMLRPKIMK